MLALSLKAKCRFKIVNFSRFAANAHRNSYTHYFLIFFQNICLGHLQHYLYRASVFFTLLSASWSNIRINQHVHHRTKWTLVQAFNIQKCKFASSIIFIEIVFVFLLSILAIIHGRPLHLTESCLQYWNNMTFRAFGIIFSKLNKSELSFL